MHAARNIRLCSKDCICLFICPTGATDTENGQIDFSKCIDGCRLCVDACPSHAIYLSPDNYAPQQKKSPEMKKSLLEMVASKSAQEMTAAGIAQEAPTPIARQLARALEMSSRINTEDLLREAGYMLPQSDETKEFLKSLLESPQPEEFPRKAVERLLELL